MDHTEKKELRRFDISVLGILQASDNLHEQLDIFLSQAYHALKLHFLALLKSHNVKISIYNIL
jgi:hypothetical protein